MATAHSTSSYVFGKSVALTHAQAVERVTAELAREGFGVLSDIDVAGTLKKKIGVELQPYRILGACNPQFAHEAVQLEPQIGALLPCNVVVRVDDAGATRVEVMDPDAVLQLVGRPDVAAIAAQVRERLQRVLEAL